MISDNSKAWIQPPATYPSVSIIMPATRPTLAEQALQALSQQSYAGKIEIIVVGPPATQLAQRWSIIAVNPGPIREPGRARNLGFIHATGTILLFVDDDMLVAKNWIALNVAALQKPQVGIVGARMPGKAHTFFARCADFTNCGYYQHSQATDEPLGAGSMGIRATVFAAAGGFDEVLCANEDIDLCYRVRQLGYRTLYQPDIVVMHDHAYNTLGKLLHHNYAHGLAAGLTTKIRYRDSTVKHRLLYLVRSPCIFLLLFPIIATVATLHIVVLNSADHKRVWLYAPFILLGKLAYEFGIYINLRKGCKSW